MDQELLQQLWKWELPALGSQASEGVPPSLAKVAVEGQMGVPAETITIHEKKFLIKVEVPHLIQESKGQPL